MTNEPRQMKIALKSGTEVWIEEDKKLDVCNHMELLEELEAFASCRRFLSDSYRVSTGNFNLLTLDHHVIVLEAPKCAGTPVTEPDAPAESARSNVKSKGILSKRPLI